MNNFDYEPDYPIYRPYFPQGGPFDNFFLKNANKTISQQIEMVIIEDAPILETIVLRRVARAWGVARFTNRVETRLKELIPKWAIAKGPNPDFLWCPERVSPSHCHFRGATNFPCSKRKIHQVCLEELGCTILHSLDKSNGVHTDNLIRETCRIMGANSTKAAHIRVREAILLLERENRVKFLDSYVYLHDNQPN